MSASKGGVVTNGLWNYTKLMLVIGLLFGTTLMMSLNHAVVDVGAHFVGSIVGELPNAADTIKKIQASVGQKG